GGPQRRRHGELLQSTAGKGHPVYDAVLQGAATRLRTVLMTPLLAMPGLLPMALAPRIRSETQRPLALRITGGPYSAPPLDPNRLADALPAHRTPRQPRYPSCLGDLPIADALPRILPLPGGEGRGDSELSVRRLKVHFQTNFGSFPFALRPSDLSLLPRHIQ